MRFKLFRFLYMFPVSSVFLVYYRDPGQMIKSVVGHGNNSQPHNKIILSTCDQVLWAPIVDSVFWARFGRRKSWLVPAQYLIGQLRLMSYIILKNTNSQ